MLFLNTALLLGALGIAIPIVIHLLNRRTRKVIDWGAMNFLLESLAVRNRRIQLEEAMLMATRCLLVGLLALALARPFIPPGSTIPWLLILPLILLGVVGLGVAIVLHSEPRWRKWILIFSIAILLSCVGLGAFEKFLNLSRFAPGSRQDIALIIDGSTSMSILAEGETNFERAIAEASDLIKRAPRGHAFSLILGGPSPTGIILDPTTDRAALQTALESLQAIDGAMSTYDSLTLASLSLTRGSHPAKQIVLLTDEQNIGWEIGETGRWKFLSEAFANLPSEPQVMIRKLPLPDYLRNLVVAKIELSREIVGIDRPVDIRVTVENTGNEAVTPSALLLRVGGEEANRDPSIAQLLPDESHTVTFTHQFSEPGAHAISAEIEVADDIVTDNTGYFATNVVDQLRVLVVEGNPSERSLAKASTFAAVALAPSSLTLDPTLEANRPGASDEAAEDFDMFYDPTLDLIDFLVEPVVVDLVQLATLAEFDAYDVVILGDVPRLPAKTAALLAKYVDLGGGLLVTAGPKAQASFYNEWQLVDNTPLLPAQINNQLTVAPGGDPFYPSLASLNHPALKKIADPDRSDFGELLIKQYRGQRIPDNLTRFSSVGAKLNNGEILLSSRIAGKGRVILTGMPFDLSAGNLVTRQSYLPYLHELVHYLANPGYYGLQLDPGWEIALPVTVRRGRAIGQGLKASYFSNSRTKEPAITRTDETIQFNWGTSSPGAGVPPENFKVKWQGSLQVPETNRYAFSVELDGRFTISLDEKRVADFRSPGGRRQMSRKMEANQWYNFEAIFEDEGGPAEIVLHWESPDMPRQPIPSSAFRTFTRDESLAGGKTALTTYQVVGPNQRPRTARLSTAGDGSVLKLHGEISSGLYELQIPKEQRPFFSHLLRPESNEIPFTVTRDSNESRLMKLTEADYAFVENFITLSFPQTLEDLVSFLNGNQFGQELWRYLAIGALLLILTEILLSRWIAKSRRLGEKIVIQFETRDTPSSRFHEELAGMKSATVPSSRTNPPQSS
ncbi:MAG: PA14 domain-containing protein [Verrucomicrobiota bacterium]